MSEALVQWPERMNPTDALFWYLDTIPELRSTIGALVRLERAPDADRLRAEIGRMAQALPRMHQVVAETPLGLAPPEWLDDGQFDLDYHVRTIAVPAPGSMAELLAAVGPLYATPLDRNRPLWEAYVAEGLEGGRAAVFLKLHHCLVDGVGGSHLLVRLLGDQRGSRTAPAPRRQPARSAAPLARLWRGARCALEDGAATRRAIVRAACDSARDPLGALRSAGDLAQRVRGLVTELTTPRADSPLHARRSLSRQLATFDLSLPAIDAVRRTLDATNNDVVLTIVSGALHRWHTSRGADVKDLRALVPVNLRAPGQTMQGNHLALLAMDLPIGEPNPVARLRLIQRRMGAVKRDRRATLYPLVARVLVRLPMALTLQVGRQQTVRTNFVCTNVPGPRHLCHLAGEPITAIYPFAPLVGDHPVAIALYSYRDTLHVGLDVDPLAMPDLPHFLDALGEAYAEVLGVGGADSDRPGSVV
ncbi:MAG: wax ester/triacylglycerol synthase family O-acyltransferase [Candidatus Binatia bacterium]